MLNENKDFPFSEPEIRAALRNYRDEDGMVVAHQRVRVKFSKPRRAAKWACLLQMKSIDEEPGLMKQAKGMMGELKKRFGFSKAL